MTVLEDPAALESMDSQLLLPALAGAAAQVRAAAALAGEHGLPELTGGLRPRALVVIGGGVAADAVAALADQAPVPVVLCPRELPAWVGALDVVLVAPSAGGVPGAEPSAEAEEARRRGSRVLCLGDYGLPLPTVPSCLSAPPGGPPGGYWPVLVGLRAAALACGLVPGRSGEVSEAADRLAEIAVSCRVSSESFLNLGKERALAWEGTVPVVWGTSLLTVAAGRRLVGSLRGYARTPAVALEPPEAWPEWVSLFDGSYRPGSRLDPFHDPYEDPPVAGERSPIHLVLLRDAPAAESAGSATAALTLRGLAEEAGIGVTELLAEGDTALERLASLVGLGDWAAAYLGLLQGHDPGFAPACAKLAARPTVHEPA